MIDLAALQLQTPEWLMLLPPLWILLWLLVRFNLRQSMWTRVCDAHLLDKMRLSGSAKARQSLLIWPLGLVLTLVVLAASGPGWRASSSPVMEAANARIVILDLSQRMRVTDVEPDRFTQAVAAAQEIIGGEFDGETGLVVYAGAAFVVSPLSRDANTLLAFLDALEPGLLPLEGARLDLAIESAQDLLLASISGRGQIIVIGNSDDQSKAVAAARQARERGHRVSILAIGTAAGGPLIDSKGTLLRDGNGNFVIAKTDFARLRSVARAGGGFFFAVDGTGGYDASLGTRISADMLVEASAGSNSGKRDIANEGYWLIWLALPFALLLFRRNLLWVVFVALLLPPDHPAMAADGDSIWQHREHQAYMAFKQQEYQRSVELTENPMLLGAAYYRLGAYGQALEAFSRANSAAAHYNRGNTLVQLERIADAIVAYQRALALNPGHIDARYNLKLLEYFQQQQSAATSEQGDNPNSEPGELDPGKQADAESRPGVIGEQILNPGDEQRLESGFGASAQLGHLDPFEQFDGREQMQPDRFSLSDGINPEQAEILVEGWVRNLPSASSDLFRRKFIRDYQRQQQQTR